MITLSPRSIWEFLPNCRTFVAISKRSSPSEVKSLIERSTQYESGSLAGMLPIYVRGVAYLAVDAPAQAEAEFRKIITHHSVDATTTLYPLSVLGTARCYRLQGRKAESRQAYLQVFRIWKRQDRDLPILHSAKGVRFTWIVAMIDYQGSFPAQFPTHNSAHQFNVHGSVVSKFDHYWSGQRTRASTAVQTHGFHPRFACLSRLLKYVRRPPGDT